MKPLAGVLFAMLSGLAMRNAAVTAEPSPLAGTWVLVAADKVLPDGAVAHDYGEMPKGRLVIDARGRYSLQIFKHERLRFSTDSKADGNAEELKSAVMGSSTHYGTVAVDTGENQLVFSIEGASFPNWEGTIQKRRYRLDGGELRYEVPPRADGSIPISVWRRME
jgi:hypothetical protein